MFHPIDEKMMSRAIALAEQGGDLAHPNPRVGCVIVRGGRVVGEGWHERFGGPHAEAMALHRAGAHARGATLYVTLEPCPHWGKTPPCAAAVVRAGVSRVCVATRDPSVRLSGRGIALLRNAGVRVTSGVLARRAKLLNQGFFSESTVGSSACGFENGANLGWKNCVPDRRLPLDHRSQGPCLGPSIEGRVGCGPGGR
ncbi:MAG: bifunctional diaminohydroxyphosphoribosylaminopyrimidine deaminase/5-amino-6-(5-phosphoribosylamino)uracil reductase RibD [Elusimicrobia bacterium]|nr:bifunctional diaminohydroxyphosphoribosylaminopyrimidine deaminase/5-amino-6-(5-phosphoribosylamino)uracil reductase RibD [Elusimicrobiota bacterium]